MCKLYFWDKHEAALIGPRDLGQNREHLKAGFCLLAKASYKSDYRATCRLDNWPERGKNRCHRRGQSSWNRLLTWRTIVIVVVRRVSPTAAFHCPTNSMECRRPSLSSLQHAQPLRTITDSISFSATNPRFHPPPSSFVLAALSFQRDLSMVASATTSPLYRRTSVVRGVWCG